MMTHECSPKPHALKALKEDYWGMATLDYQIGMLVKKQMYQHAGKRLVFVYPRDLPQIDQHLSQKLVLLGRSGELDAR